MQPCILNDIRGGDANEALTTAMREATERVKATHKKATVTLTLTIEPADKSDSEVARVWVKDAIKVSLPQLPQRDSLFFVDPETSALSRTDPQQRLFDGEPSADQKTRAAG